MTIRIREYDLAEENAVKILIEKELRQYSRTSARITKKDMEYLGPVGPMGAFCTAAFGEDSDRDGFKDPNDTKGYDSEYVDAENDGLISNLFGKIVVGPHDFDNGFVDRRGAIEYCCHAELGLARKVNGHHRELKNLVAGQKNSPAPKTGRRIYVRPK